MSRQPDQPGTESFGLPADVPHLIAKLRVMPAELRDQILTTTDQEVTA